MLGRQQTQSSRGLADYFQGVRKEIQFVLWVEEDDRKGFGQAWLIGIFPCSWNWVDD